LVAVWPSPPFSHCSSSRRWACPSWHARRAGDRDLPGGFRPRDAGGRSESTRRPGTGLRDLHRLAEPCWRADARPRGSDRPARWLSPPVRGGSPRRGRRARDPGTAPGDMAAETGRGEARSGAAQGSGPALARRGRGWPGLQHPHGLRSGGSNRGGPRASGTVLLRLLRRADWRAAGGRARSHVAGATDRLVTCLRNVGRRSGRARPGGFVPSCWWGSEWSAGPAMAS